MNNENFITNVKRKLINKNLEVKKYVYGDTIPTIGEKKDAIKKYCLGQNWLWSEDSYVDWAFGRGANSVENYILNYERMPSDKMIEEWSIEDDRFNGKIFIAGADFVKNYEINKDVKKYNL
jgi:hypothetical protein